MYSLACAHWQLDPWAAPLVLHQRQPPLVSTALQILYKTVTLSTRDVLSSSFHREVTGYWIPLSFLPRLCAHFLSFDYTLYWIVAQISLILSIFNLVLATPIVVREIHDARNDEKVVAGNVAATPTSAGSSPDAMATPQHDPSLLDGDEARNDGTVIAEDVAATQTSAGSSPDATAPPQHHPSLLDGDEARNDGTVIADDVAATQMSAGSSPDAIAPPQHHPSLSDGSVSPGYPAPYLSEGSSASGNSLRVNPPGSWHEPALYNPINTAPSTPSWASPTWWPPGGPPGDWPSSTPESSVISIPDWLGLGSPPPPDDAKFFNKNMMKKLKIAAGVIIVGGAIAAIVGSQIKHRNKHREYQDS